MNVLRAAFAEIRLQRRYGLLYAALVVALTGILAIWFLPPPTRVYLLPLILVMDTIAFGFFLLPGMLFLEKSDGVLAAIAATPISSRRYLMSKVAALTVLAVAVAVAVAAVASGAQVRWGYLVAGMIIGSVLTMLASFLLASRFSSISRYVVPSILLTLVAQAPAIEYIGTYNSLFLYLIPTMAPLVLFRGAVGETLTSWELIYAFAYGALSSGVLLAWSGRAFERLVGGGIGRRRQGSSARSAPRRAWKRRSPLLALAAADLRGLWRDPMLLFMTAYAVFLALIGRWLIPWLVDSAPFPFDLSPYVVLILTFLAIQTGPLVLGAVSGLILLDERDDGALTALRVTALPMNHYALYRAGLPTLLCALVCVVAVWFVGIVDAPPHRIAVVALLTGIEAPLFALFLASFANNKVEGLALGKIMGVFMFPPMVAWFVEPPWQWLFGIVPTFWPAAAFWQAMAPDGWFWTVAVAGIATHLVALGYLLRRFRRAI